MRIHPLDSFRRLTVYGMGNLQRTVRLSTFVMTVILLTFDTGLGQPSSDPIFANMAVLVVGGANRTLELDAAYRTWTSVFRHRLFVTDEDLLPNNPSKIASVSWNAFKGLPSDHSKLLSRLYNHTTTVQLKETLLHQDPQWLVSQAKLLLGIRELTRRHPNAQWYWIADSDTFMFPYRLASSLGLLGHLDPGEPLAFGRKYRVRVPNEDAIRAVERTGNTLRRKGSSIGLNIFLGGAGVILSRAAMEMMNEGQNCVDQQYGNLVWSQIPSDHRLGLCLHLAHVPKIDVWHMYQSNERLLCDSAHGMGIRKCAWGMHYRHTVSKCPLSLHYQGPGLMAEHFASVIDNQVCQPIANYEAVNCTCRRKSAIGTHIPMPDRDKRAAQRLARFKADAKRFRLQHAHQKMGKIVR